MDWSLLVTVAVGIVAISLSIYFYMETRKLNAKTNTTLTEIEKNVIKLETLYNKYIEKILDKFIEDHDIHREQAFKIMDDKAKKSQDDND